MNKEYARCKNDNGSCCDHVFLNVVKFIDIGSYHYQTMRIVIQNVMIPVEIGNKNQQSGHSQLKYHRRP